MSAALLIPSKPDAIFSSLRRSIEGGMSALANTLCLAGAFLLANALQPDVGWCQSNPQQSATLDSNPVGKVQNVSGTAHIEHATAVLVQANLPSPTVGQAKVGDLVYRGDVVETGVNGQLGITFADGTSVNFSSDARLEVNEFIYDPRSTSNSTLISLTQGTFNFISGAIAKSGQMKIDTPVGTIGIRGTAPRVEISKDGSVKFTTMIEEK
jgi:FecR protein